MQKKTIAVIFGGCSTEYQVSLQSAFSVLEHLNTETYHILPVGITREGDWYLYDGNLDRLPDNTWWEDGEHLTPVAISQNRTHPGMLAQKGEQLIRIPLDLAFPILHGKNGEDGTVQGQIGRAHV